ncbi:MAG: 1-deoxy-D-xylulose-5-phosphate synthase [Bacteroidaceae bacterium]
MSTKQTTNINSPEELKQLEITQLPSVCDNLRQEIVNQLSTNPGHFAANLGTIELTVALHYVFNTPYDRLVWDVGHQAYAHKLLTGRREAFHTNRQLNGIRPFPSPEESPYDTFSAGHASNSISAALGMAVAAKQKHENREVVAIIGDGAMSGGLAFEGLNNASSMPNDLLIIINDNDMSIDRSVGGMSQYLVNLTTSNPYNKIRYTASRALFKMGVLNDDRRKALIRLGNSVKSFLTRQRNLFEGMDIRYFGPTDGHDVENLVRVLREVKKLRGPKILHLHTKKGKGYAPAEKDPPAWHAPGYFNPITGEKLKADGTLLTAEDKKKMPPRYQEIFGETLLELAQKNDLILGVTPAMPSGCSMNIMQHEMPGRVFDVGIAEAHSVTFSGGLAKDGMIPFCNVYSTFMQRAYDNLIHDVALLKLPVVLCLDRAGIVGQDGPTHQGAFDLAYLRPIPNVIISSPMNAQELRHLMYTAQLPRTEMKGPFVIRYPRGNADGAIGGDESSWRCEMHKIPIGTGRKLRDGDSIALLSLGPLGNVAVKAAEEAHTKYGLEVAHYDMRFLKPLDTELMATICKNHAHLITIEDGVLKGGLASAVSEYVTENQCAVTLDKIGIDDQFVVHGLPKELYKICNMDQDSVVKMILKRNK